MVSWHKQQWGWLSFFFKLLTCGLALTLNQSWQTASLQATATGRPHHFPRCTFDRCHYLQNVCFPNKIRFPCPNWQSMSLWLRVAILWHCDWKIKPPCFLNFFDLSDQYRDICKKRCLGTSWMGWGPVDWSSQNQNSKINGLSFLNFFDLSDRYWDFCKKQFLGTSWMGWGPVEWVGDQLTGPPRSKIRK